MLIRRWAFAILLAAIALLAACGASGPQPPAAAAGRIDLRGWDFQRDGIAALDGEWLFDGGRLDDPAAAPAGVPWRVPGAWNGAPTAAGPAGAEGYGTYRLRIDCTQPEGLALSLPMQHSAARWFANGREVARQGTPGTSADTALAAQVQGIAHLGDLHCPIDLVAQVSNFDVRRGGLLRSVELGDARQLHDRRELLLARDLFTMGVLGVMTVVPLLFYATRRKDRAPLYLALFCLSLALSIGLSGTRLLQPYLGALGWGGYLRVLFCAWNASLLCFALFVQSVYPKAVDRRAVRALAGWTAGTLVVVLLTPSIVYSGLVPLMEGVAALMGLYLLYALGRLALQGRRSAGLLLLGVLALAGTALHDVLNFAGVARGTLVPIGVLAFVLAPGLLLVRRLSRALSLEERMAIEQRERADLLLRSTKAGMLDWDAVLGTVKYSDRLREMLGYPPEAPGAPSPPAFWDMLHPDDAPRINESFKRQLRDRSVRGGVRSNEPIDYRLRRMDGSWLWVHAEAVSVCGDDGRTLRFITSFIDISQAKRHEAEMEERLRTIDDQQKRLDLVVRGAQVGIVDWDGLTHETYYSPRFREIRGYPPDADTRGWPDYFKVMIHPDDRERVTRRWVAFIKGKGPEGPHGEFYAPEEYRLLRADGSYVWVQVSGVAVRDAQGFVRRWIAAIIDITARREQEEALKETVRLREEVERIARHDIKTPLNSIIAVPRLLREERRLGADEDELLGIVERAGYRILSMVNLSLDLYKMENGSYIFRPDAVDLLDLLDKVLSDLRTHAASKNVALRVVHDEAPPYAWAEELLCYSLLANLLKNAVEASPDGAVVTVTLARDPAGAHVLLNIHNQGAVPESVRPHFFTKYATAGKASGTGLGSYSARLMARVQDGELEMATSEAAGTTITARLRAAPPGIVPTTVRHLEERRLADPGMPGALPALDVLLVDDDEYNLLIVRRFLPTPPLAVRTAINGRTALELVARRHPDAVIMDLDMPVMGGLDAVRALREHEARDGLPRSLAVALSSHDDAATREAAIAAGFDHYLSKPVTREVVQKTLALLAARQPANAPPVPVPLQAAPGARAGRPGPDDVVRVDADVVAAIPGFLASRRALVDTMRGAMEAGDRDAVRSTAHRLAGSLALYGFHWAADHSRRIETLAGQLDAPTFDIMARELAHHLDTVDTEPAA